MGKAKDPPISTSSDAPKTGKGHRQKGAGTVITAKPPVVTADGITLKAHERLPFQLVNSRDYLSTNQISSVYLHS
jgi:hypothetical protein